MIIERDNCLRLQCEVKTNDNWVSFLGYHFNFSYWLDYSKEKEREIQTSVYSVYWKDTKGEWPLGRPNFWRILQSTFFGFLGMCMCGPEEDLVQGGHFLMEPERFIKKFNSKIFKIIL